MPTYTESLATEAGSPSEVAAGPLNSFRRLDLTERTQKQVQLMNPDTGMQQESLVGGAQALQFLTRSVIYVLQKICLAHIWGWRRKTPGESCCPLDTLSESSLSTELQDHETPGPVLPTSFTRLGACAGLVGRGTTQGIQETIISTNHQVLDVWSFMVLHLYLHGPLLALQESILLSQMTSNDNNSGEYAAHLGMHKPWKRMPLLCCEAGSGSAAFIAVHFTLCLLSGWFLELAHDHQAAIDQPRHPAGVVPPDICAYIALALGAMSEADTGLSPYPAAIERSACWNSHLLAL